ncbi:MAG: TPM domain-containing protein, partial [Microbacteriaceae bacterium]
FEQPSKGPEWADATAIANGLGQFGVLLVVAVDDRDYAISVDQLFPIDASAMSNIEQKYLLPSLSKSDWYQASAQFAEGMAQDFGLTLQSVTGNTVNPTTAPTTPPIDKPSDSGLSAWWLLVPAVPIVATVVVVSRRKKKNGAADAPEKLSLKELGHRVSSALIGLDDAIKLSEQELGFAVAQFGKDATAEFRKALDEASENTKQAFKLKQLLDDHVKDTEAETRQWSTEILRLCDVANTALEAHEKAFEELRKLEENAPELVGSLQSELQSLQAEEAQIAATLQQLNTQYDAEALQAINQNPAQAKALLTFSSEQLALASSRLAEGKTSEVALALRATQQSLDQVIELNRAVNETGPALQQAQTQLDALRANVQQDLVNARSLNATALVGIGQDLAQIQQESESTLAQLSGRNPAADLARLDAVNTRLDQVMANTMSLVERRQRVVSTLAQALPAAERSITEARHYVTTRRGGIGVDARTRLADAEQKFTQAVSVQQSDPEQSLNLANQSISSAQLATRLATQDVQQTYGGNSGGPDLGGILGFLLGSYMSGGGGNRSRGSSWGSSGSRGTNWGSSGGSRSSSGGGFRSSSGGGFGGSRSSGSSSSGRRSSGGRF